MAYTDQFKGKKQPILIQFYADWCPPCRMLSPIVKEVAETYADQITVEQINVDTNQDIAAEFGVRSIPAMFVLQETNIAWQHVGYMPLSELTRSIEHSTHITLTRS
ncbi:thioredoxin family protein [Neptunitalea lumnitzerae]|uniref:Thioredoxin n=1 Tax=Neptunitalea lumnitzerae TaxID=2965509 RepID=A0ABQ5MJ72_9FLAO|nr:thioredoxin family protein [Neptunitalea sp. Y10]GLB49435.1 thioredoxin [Neptunitalea sp. Y10]